MAKDGNIYRKCRDDAGLTRDKASELLEWISADRIDRIERGTAPHPDEVLQMAHCYKRPELCNYYCTHECRIGQELIPEVRVKDLANIVLEMLSTLNTLDKEKNRLIEITADGAITEDEYHDFALIQQRLEDISMSVDSLKLWVRTRIAEGEMTKDALKTAGQNG